MNPYESPSTKSGGLQLPLATRPRRGRFIANAFIVIPCLILPIAVTVFLIDGPGGVGELFESNIRHLNIHLFLLGAAFGFVTLRKFVIIPLFDESLIRLVLSSILIFPAWHAIAIAVQSFANTSFSVPPLGVVAAFATAGCLIEFAIAKATVGRRRTCVAER